MRQNGAAPETVCISDRLKESGWFFPRRSARRMSSRDRRAKGSMVWRKLPIPIW